MIRPFYWSLLVGVALTLLIASVFPLPRHERYRSSINVLPNGGRQEEFIIQWPQDRIETHVSPDSGLLAGAGAVMLAGPGGPVASAEVFRLRDVVGNIIGLASRVTSRAPSTDGRLVESSDWILLIPSRGALYLTQVNATGLMPKVHTGVDSSSSVVAAVDSPGFWGETRHRRITAGPTPDGSGVIVRGTEEFAGLGGSYEETWDLGEPAANGTTRGRIMLSTRSETSH